MRAGVARLLFCLAAAVASVALADPVVETLSNRGAFGTGHFTDQSTADVLPAFATACIFAGLFLIGVVRRTLPRSGMRQMPGWLRESRAAVPLTTALRLFPVTFALQIGTLFGAETLEQVDVAGHTLGGTIWLGGPVLVSVCMHAAIGLLVVVALARLLDWIARSIVEAIVFFRRLVVAWDALSPAIALLAYLVPPGPSEAPAIAGIHGRGPPHSALS